MLAVVDHHNWMLDNNNLMPATGKCKAPFHTNYHLCTLMTNPDHAYIAAALDIFVLSEEVVVTKAFSKIIINEPGLLT